MFYECFRCKTREFSLDRVLETAVKPCQNRNRNGKLLHGALVVKHNIV